MLEIDVLVVLKVKRLELRQHTELGGDCAANHIVVQDEASQRREICHLSWEHTYLISNIYHH